MLVVPCHDVIDSYVIVSARPLTHYQWRQQLLPVAVQTTRRRSMQVPIDIRLIDPKLYGVSSDDVINAISTSAFDWQSVKAASFDAEVGDDDDVTRPLLHFAIEYSVDAEELMVKLIQVTSSGSCLWCNHKACCLQARNLEAAGGQPVINPYLSIELMPDYVRRRSRVHQSTRDPEFAESFTFPLLHDEIDVRRWRHHYAPDVLTTLGQNTSDSRIQRGTICARRVLWWSSIKIERNRLRAPKISTSCYVAYRTYVISWHDSDVITY